VRAYPRTKPSGAVIGAFDSVVLESDETFDRFVYSSLSESLGVLIDPVFAVNGDLLAGAMIFDLRACVDRESSAELGLLNH
jgi:hypothetical protein